MPDPSNVSDAVRVMRTRSNTSDNVFDPPPEVMVTVDVAHLPECDAIQIFPEMLTIVISPEFTFAPEFALHINPSVLLAPFEPPLATCNTEDERYPVFSIPPESPI